MSMQKYYKISEVAKIFGVHHDTVKKWCIAGDIEANNIGGTWFIPTEATETYERGEKPKRVQMLEKQNERLQEQIEAMQMTIRRVAGTLLETGGEL